MSGSAPEMKSKGKENALNALGACNFFECEVLLSSSPARRKKKNDGTVDPASFSRPSFPRRARALFPNTKKEKSFAVFLLQSQ